MIMTDAERKWLDKVGENLNQERRRYVKFASFDEQWIRKSDCSLCGHNWNVHSGIDCPSNVPNQVAVAWDVSKIRFKPGHPNFPKLRERYEYLAAAYNLEYIHSPGYGVAFKYEDIQDMRALIGGLENV